MNVGQGTQRLAQAGQKVEVSHRMVVAELPPDDEMLVRLAQERTAQGKSTLQGQAAFTILYERYRHPVFKCIFSHGIRQEQLIEDLTQETFAKAWRGLPQKPPAAPFHRWLFVIAINEVRGYFRFLALKKNDARVSSLEGITEANPGTLPPSIDPPIDEHLIQLEDIGRTFDELPLQERRCLALVYGYGLSVAEAARKLGIKQSSVTAALSRARKHFKKYYHDLD
jgi:RNA polymerase sigma-70 factor (ECF subfamily)